MSEQRARSAQHHVPSAAIEHTAPPQRRSPTEGRGTRPEGQVRSLHLPNCTQHLDVVHAVPSHSRAVALSFAVALAGQANELQNSATAADVVVTVVVVQPIPWLVQHQRCFSGAHVDESP
mmetsp:Transcript_139192/g.444822  ORF Transcript_139192/g.444822 Transcript_139192/m.444822 type:complete len:120 (-) Transcript_139192:1622-1981(-)